MAILLSTFIHLPASARDPHQRIIRLCLCNQSVHVYTYMKAFVGDKIDRWAGLNILSAKVILT